MRYDWAEQGKVIPDGLSLIVKPEGILMWA